MGHARYRVYADDSVVHEDDFEEQDNAQPYYDDYKEFVLPECLIEFIKAS